MLPLLSRASLAAAAIALAQQAATAATVYTSRTTFNTATTALDKTDSDFELVAGYTVPRNYDNFTGYQTTDPDGIPVDGHKYVGDGPFGNETYLIHSSTSGGFYNIAGDYTMVLGRQSGSIDLAPGVFAFGFEYRLDRSMELAYLPSTIQATVTFADTTTANYSLDVINGNSFWGVYSSSAIDSISFNSSQAPESYQPGGDYTPYLLVDNVVSGQLSAVPEPSQSIASGLVAGFALTIIGRRNRKKATAAI